MGRTIMNIAAGKFLPESDLLSGSDFIVNVDTMYYNGSSTSGLERYHDLWNSEGREKQETLYINEDIFIFMERCRIKFDVITIYRFLEHVNRTDILYFIYLLSTSVVKDGFIDVIVPDYETLANILLMEDVNSKDFEFHDILLTTEILNEKTDPHTSIWTSERAVKFFELENRFKVMSVKRDYEFDGRDIYLRFRAKRV